MAKPIRIAEIKGMNNVARQVATTVQGIPEPSAKIILNMDTTSDKKQVMRDGGTLFKAIVDAHSLSTDGLSLFLAGKGATALESLYRLTPQGVLTELAAIRGKGDPLFYIFFPDKVFISSKSWNGIYDYATVRAWGVAGSDNPDLTAIYNSEQILPLNSGPPPYMENLCLAGGRIWGTRGVNVHYNDPPMAYEMYRPDTFLPFTEELTMIAKTQAGLYFASLNKTWFGAGFDPFDMIFTEVGDGALPGSLQYMPNYKNNTDVPIWTGRNAIYAGIQGTVLQLTNEKVTFDGTGQAASLFRDKGGTIQYVSNFVLPDVGFGDEATCEVFRNGKLI